MFAYSIATIVLAAQCFASPDASRASNKAPVKAGVGAPTYDSNQAQVKEILKDMLAYSDVAAVDAEMKIDLAMKILFQNSDKIVKYLSTPPSALCSSNARNSQEPIYTPPAQYYASIIDKPYYSNQKRKTKSKKQ